jgi:glycosyltransferase involved in cell wall biosynthesis
MRIVLSNASFSWGGVHVVTETLARGLQERGHEVTLLCRPDSLLQRRLDTVVPTVPVVRGPDLEPIRIARIGKALRRIAPDVVLTLMEKDVRLTALAARVLGIPVVVRRANDRPMHHRLGSRLLYRAAVRHLVANSVATRATMLRSAPWLRPSEVTVIHNGVDVERITATTAAELRLPDDAIVFGFVGRFDLRKGVLDLAHAWPAVAARVPNAHLVIVGRGDCESVMRQRLRDVPRVHWLGYHDDVFPLVRAMHVLLVPSHWEGFGLVAAEGLAAGVPVIATRASSLPEIVADGVTGRLVPPHDPHALAAAMVDLALDPARRLAYGAAGRRHARSELSETRMVERYELLLTSIAAAPSVPVLPRIPEMSSALAFLSLGGVV